MTRRTVSWHAGALALALSCGHPAAAPPPLVPVSQTAAASDACLLAPDSIAAPASMGIGVPDVRGFVERQMYETLIRIDCRGATDPQLAQSWTGGDAGHRWTFTLRPGARFSDGVPLVAADVFAALTRDSSWLDGGAVALESVDRVSVRFPAELAGVPPVFADPALGVSRLDVTSGARLGSGAVRVDSSSGVVTLTSLVPGRPTVTVRSSAGGDARDLLDHGIDILVSGDPEVLSYAGGRSDLRSVPLPWDRVYVLLSPQLLTIGDTVRAGFARDVVRTDARPARGSYWWMAGPACPAGAGIAAMGSSPAPVVYYPQGDAAARGLAERLVALGLLGPGGRASGVAAADFDARVAAGGASYLVALPREALAPCHAVADLAARATWLSGDPGRHLMALGETRRRAIVRRGGSAFTVDWDGTLRVR
ncbi:MAG TPA: ABC transporter substrate-binding protein [Gemmatimonadales bacterium]|nr:ABC transporter substrate-binding protein [Gemmatimonadales bacterium]